MDVGMGVHGEAGIRRAAPRLLGRGRGAARSSSCSPTAPPAGDPVQVLVNTLGATTLMEAYVLLGRVVAELGEERGVTVARALAGEYVTSLEMAGLSVTLTALAGGPGAAARSARGAARGAAVAERRVTGASASSGSA